MPAAIVVLLPAQVGGKAISCECDWRPPVDQPTRLVAFGATSIDPGYEWIAARTLAGALGLGDEWEESGPDWTVPSIDATLSLLLDAPNLATLPDPTQATSPAFYRWSHYTAAQRRAPPTPIPHPGDAASPDLSLPAAPFSAPDLEPYEGGGGFRTQLLRPARDCLMRRRVGTAQSPKRNPAPLCTLCRRALTRAVL